MAATLRTVSAHLHDLGIKHEIRGEHIAIAYTTHTYRDPEGEGRLFLAITLEEDGRYFKLFAPNAFKATGPHADAFFRATAIVQWKTKLIQFEYDPKDGEVRPIVEFPLMDAALTAEQLERCVRGIVGLLEEYGGALQAALDTGTVAFDDGPEGEAEMGEFLGSLPPEVLAAALREAERRRN